jgi:hypothetical protein
MTITTPDIYTCARTILGPDFISPEEIAVARDLVYADEQLGYLHPTIPNQMDLEWCRDNGMVLVAGPPTAMTILDVRAVHAGFFFMKGPDQDDGDWYDDASEKFTKTDKVEALTWIAFRKEPVEDSLSKNWSEQQVLVAEPMTIPNAAEATWVLTTYKAVRNVNLLDCLYVRTSSVRADSRCVSVGDFDAVGLDVNGYWDDGRLCYLGVSASRKF